MSVQTRLTALLVVIYLAAVCAAQAQSINAGGRDYVEPLPFVTATIAEFDTPWAMAFLPDGRLLVTEKPGALYLVTQTGQKTPIAGLPAVAASGQNGLLDVAIAPDFAQSSHIYLTFIDPIGTRLALARARLDQANGQTRLDDLTVLWQQNQGSARGHPGGIIAFDPQGRYLFLSVGDRMHPATAQDPNLARGKVLRFDLTDAASFNAPLAGQTWTSGHRNPYGLAFNAKGQLWLHEMGPRGGDEFNLITRGANYGWPIVSNGDNYSGVPIPDHITRPEFAAPALYWTPGIAPSGLAFYKGDMFPDLRGAALLGGLVAQALIGVKLGQDGTADEFARWDMGARIRDVAVAPDGAIWVIEDEDPGRLLRLTPAR